MVVVSDQTTETGSTSKVPGEGVVPPPPDLLPTFSPDPDLKEGLDATFIRYAPAHRAGPEHFPIVIVKYVASYNWTDAAKLTIVVPGTMLSLPYVFVLISVIDSLQVCLLYELGTPSHSHCSPTMLSYILTGIVQSCPNTRCCHFWSLRTRYIL